jgi:hypothetical protein
VQLPVGALQNSPAATGAHASRGALFMAINTGS